MHTAMGTYLSTPKTEKQSADGEGARVRYGLASMQGWRTTMEDAVSFSFPLHLPCSLSLLSARYGRTAWVRSALLDAPGREESASPGVAAILPR